jgi:cytochrome b involved in lipid metabolism
MTASTTLKQITRDDVAAHNTAGDLWIIIDSIVYDLSKFGKMHPGGLGVLLDEDVGEYEQEYERCVLCHIELR